MESRGPRKRGRRAGERVATSKNEKFLELDIRAENKGPAELLGQKIASWPHRPSAPYQASVTHKMAIAGPAEVSALLMGSRKQEKYQRNHKLHFRGLLSGRVCDKQTHEI